MVQIELKASVVSVRLYSKIEDISQDNQNDMIKM